jgi:hypothetical protein
MTNMGVTTNQNLKLRKIIMTIEFEGKLHSTVSAIVDLHDSSDGMCVSEAVSAFRYVIGHAQQLIDELQRIPIPRVDPREIPSRYFYADVEG